MGWFHGPVERAQPPAGPSIRLRVGFVAAGCLTSPSVAYSQVDAIFKAAAQAANAKRIPLAKLTVEETGMGNVEDKACPRAGAARPFAARPEGGGNIYT